MLRIKEAIVVEGRYDKNALSQVVDTLILETGGFHIFKDPEQLALLCRAAEKLMGSARRFSLAWCRKAVVRCGQVDLAMKSSGQDGKELLTQLLLELSQPARARQEGHYAAH